MGKGGSLTDFKEIRLLNWMPEDRLLQFNCI